MANGATTRAPAAEDHITLSQAAKLAPWRPSSNCVWRWCREGVKAASGTRVRRSARKSRPTAAGEGTVPHAPHHERLKRQLS